MASVVAIVVVQGSLTVVGVLVGDVLPAANLAAITATGGLLLLGVGLRLLQIRALPVGTLPGVARRAGARLRRVGTPLTTPLEATTTAASLSGLSADPAAIA